MHRTSAKEFNFESLLENANEPELAAAKFVNRIITCTRQWYSNPLFALTKMRLESHKLETKAHLLSSEIYQLGRHNEKAAENKIMIQSQ